MRRLRVAALVLLPIALVIGTAVVVRPATTDRPVANIGVPVARPFEPDGTSSIDCGDNVPCLEQALGNVAAAFGPNAAWDELDRLISAGQMPSNNCHLATHRIAAGAMVWTGGSIKAVLAAYRPSCADGYIHGAMDDLLSDLPSNEIGPMAAQIAQTCGDPLDWPNIFEQSNCAHGAGHALMLHSGYDLPLALDACRVALPTVDDDNTVVLGCINGAFMENFNPSYDVTGSWLDYEDPFAPCRELALSEAEELSCWIHTSYALKTLYLDERDDDVAGFARACDTLEPLPRNRCYLGLGRELGMFDVDPSFVLETCRLGGDDDSELPCVFQAAYQKIFILRGTTDDPARDVRRLCALLRSGPTAEACWRGIGHAAYTDPSHDATGTPFERCRVLLVPEGRPLELCVRQANGEPYFPGTSR